jgi:hypothetical protein
MCLLSDLEAKPATPFQVDGAPFEFVGQSVAPLPEYDDLFVTRTVSYDHRPRWLSHRRCDSDRRESGWAGISGTTPIQ